MGVVKRCDCLCKMLEMERARSGAPDGRKGQKNRLGKQKSSFFGLVWYRWGRVGHRSQPTKATCDALRERAMLTGVWDAEGDAN